MNTRRADPSFRLRSLAVLLLALAAISACGPEQPPAPVQEISISAPVAPPSSGVAAPRASGRDLAADEANGGHTLARHVGRTDAQLAERLARERSISAASTYTDRATAERVVGAALVRSRSQVDRWLARSGARPNLTVHYRDDSGGPVGRILRRGRRQTEPCDEALVVLKWDDRRHHDFVLTSYPEAGR